MQRQVLYLGEINDNQQEAWHRVIEAFDDETGRTTQLALFPADRPLPEHAEGHGVQIRLVPTIVGGRVVIQALDANHPLRDGYYPDPRGTNGA